MFEYLKYTLCEPRKGASCVLAAPKSYLHLLHFNTRFLQHYLYSDTNTMSDSLRSAGVVAVILLTLLLSTSAFSVSSRPSASVSSNNAGVVRKDDNGEYLSREQLEFSIAYLNEHHKSDLLLPLVNAFSDLGTKSVEKNMWIGGSYTIIDASLTDITRDELHLEASIKEGEKIKTESVKIHLDADPVPGMARTYKTLPPCSPMHLNHSSRLPIDNFVRRMNRLCNIVKAYSATGKMIQLGVQMSGKGMGKLHNVSIQSL